MAQTTHQDLNLHSRKSKEPDIDTLSCWVARLEPLIRAKDKGEIIVVLANRCGTEGEAIYAGTSCVLGIEDGEVKVYGILGRGERELLIVDTEQLPQFKIVAEQNGLAERPALSLVEPLFQHLFFAGEREILQTTPVSDWDMDNKDHPPDSPSSMKVNTPWESSPGLFRAEDITKIMKAPRSYE
jgi:hypothetical protein